MIGLPRSGTSLVHNLIVKETGRKAPTFKDFGISLDNVPEVVYELNKTLRDENSLAEDNDSPILMRGSVHDFTGTLQEYKKWLSQRADSWVLKSPDHISRLPELIDVFPEARFLICLREASETLASIREYWQLVGVGPEYDILKAVRECSRIVAREPERFDWINVHTIPEWESSRAVLPTPESYNINKLYSTIKGNAKRVDSRQFKERYRIKIQGAGEA